MYKSHEPTFSYLASVVECRAPVVKFKVDERQKKKEAVARNLILRELMACLISLRVDISLLLCETTKEVPFILHGLDSKTPKNFAFPCFIN